MKRKLNKLMKVIAGAGLEQVPEKVREQYYLALCRSHRLNALSRPFEYLTLDGKLTLYAKKSCTDQLRRIHKIKIVDIQQEVRGETLITSCTVKDKKGRLEVELGAVPIAGTTREGKPYKKSGNSLANAYMASLTKAKRRATLAICGLGFLDESELSGIPEKAKSDEPDNPRKAEVIKWLVDAAKSGLITESQKQKALQELETKEGDEMISWLERVSNRIKIITAGKEISVSLIV